LGSNPGIDRQRAAAGRGQGVVQRLWRIAGYVSRMRVFAFSALYFVRAANSNGRFRQAIMVATYLPFAV
jgi:hypothetical protein